MIEHFSEFLQTITTHIPSTLSYQLDHVHYRAHSLEEYSQLLADLVSSGHSNLGEEEISGRIIATIEFSSPIAGISHLELSQPKPNQTKFDLQQLGVVVKSFTDLDTATLEYKDGNPIYLRYHQLIYQDGKEYEIKYATKTLAEVTREEQAQTS